MTHGRVQSLVTSEGAAPLLPLRTTEIGVSESIARDFPLQGQNVMKIW